MKNLILLFSFIYLVGCLEEEEKPKPKSEDFDAKSFVEDTQKLLGEIDNQEKKKDPFSLTKLTDEIPQAIKKKFFTQSSCGCWGKQSFAYYKMISYRKWFLYAKKYLI